MNELDWSVIPMARITFELRGRLGVDQALTDRFVRRA